MHTPSPSAHACTQPAQDAASAPAESKALRRTAYWLLAYNEASTAGDLLHKLYVKALDRPRCTEAERNALWQGRCAVFDRAEKWAEYIHKYGGLLFLGNPEALKVARVLEGGAA